MNDSDKRESGFCQRGFCHNGLRKVAGKDNQLQYATTSLQTHVRRHMTFQMSEEQSAATYAVGTPPACVELLSSRLSACCRGNRARTIRGLCGSDSGHRRNKCSKSHSVCFAGRIHDADRVSVSAARQKSVRSILPHNLAFRPPRQQASAHTNNL